MAGEPYAADPEGIVVFTACNAEYRAKFGFRAQKEVERHFNAPFMTALESVFPQVDIPQVADEADLSDEDRATLETASKSISLTNLGEMFRFSLLACQSDITSDEVDEIIDDIGLPGALLVMTNALKASRSFNKEAGKRPSGRPPRPPRPKRTGRS